MASTLYRLMADRIGEGVTRFLGDLGEYSQEIVIPEKSGA